MKLNGPGAYRPSTKPRAGTAVLLSLVLFLAVFLGIEPAQADKVYHYTATTKAKKAAKQGRVVASGITWQCNGSKCTVSGPWAVPGVMACKGLAQQVGAIKSYRHDAASLNSSQLSQCNGSAAAAT